jgi:hypothetical protein
MIRHIYLTDEHSPNVKPCWFGESIGHYENGDTLVVDTIGLNTRTFVDSYQTPHTETTPRRRALPHNRGRKGDRSRGSRGGSRRFHHAVDGVPALSPRRARPAGRRGLRRKQCRLFWLQGPADPDRHHPGFLEFANRLGTPDRHRANRPIPLRLALHVSGHRRAPAGSSRHG